MDPFLQVGATSHIGRQKQRNEDVFGYLIPEDSAVQKKKGGIFLVADGVGGIPGGEVAGAYAVKHILQAYYKHPSEDMAESLVAALQSAHAEVLLKARQTNAPGMCTTIVAIAVRGDRAVVANAGDSPAYLIRDGQVQQLTVEHSWTAMALTKGIITLEQAANHPNRNLVTSCLGIERTLEIYVSPQLRLQPQDTLLLCSDGLSKYVPADQVASIVADSSLSAQNAAARLQDAALERNTPDNVTALVVRVGSRPGAAPLRLPPRPLLRIVVAAAIGGLVLLFLLLALLFSPRGGGQLDNARRDAMGTQRALDEASTAVAAAITAGGIEAVTMQQVLYAQQTQIQDTIIALEETMSWQQTQTAKPTPTNTPSPTVPTDTPRPTPIPSPTRPIVVLPTAVPPTDTTGPIVSTATPTASPTSTTEPTEPPVWPTRTPTPTPPPDTDTPIPLPTLTPTETPQPTETYTPTPPPSDTPTRTPSRTPTVQPTDTPTVRPTDTPVPTETPTVRPTDTPVPTETPTAQPTDAPMPTDTPIPLPTVPTPTVEP